MVEVLIHEARTCVRDLSSEKSLAGTLHVSFWPLKLGPLISNRSHRQCLLFRQPTNLDRFVHNEGQRFIEAGTLRRRAHLWRMLYALLSRLPQSDCGATCIAADTLAEPVGLCSPLARS